MVSFRAPIFPFLINCATTVNIILTQKTRLLETLKFDYIPRVPYQVHSLQNSNKRTISSLYDDNEEPNTTLKGEGATTVQSSMILY
ncbi:unnamed protein product [Rotaria socialis]